MKKRIVLLLSAVALMVVMLATSVAPASGAQLWNCSRLEPRDSQIVTTKDDKNRLEAMGYQCTKVPKKIKPEPI
jgi:hypothetical protein